MGMKILFLNFFNKRKLISIIFFIQEYVKAHNGILGNERADALARQGAEMYRQAIKNS